MTHTGVTLREWAEEDLEALVCVEEVVADHQVEEGLA
jgi:hypothetical protein